MQISEEVKRGNRTFAMVVRGHPDDFARLVQLAKSADLYVVFTKTSFQKLVIEEVPF